ncbi:HU family DNA-binding protein [Tannerella forsythia]|uniref:DNA-binding protein HU n=1 Tax=Tannerella forsythia TaxID=28112 RepID=A0A1D3UVI4_TANFO|nr:HU family DNA-binding protein [Tannerella forsythia]SCQ24210.1 DNA-binding protein HU [Tannerella forsythia]
MDEKLSIYDIAEILTAKTGREKADIETFIETLIAVINDVITHNGVVRIKGIGSFKVIPVKERESIHVNTGERIVIPAHHKLSFLPDKILKEKINRPFAFFEAIETNETENNETASSGLSNDDEEDENDEPITAEEPVQKPVREVTKATEDIAPKTEENPAPLLVLPSEDEIKEGYKMTDKEIEKEPDDGPSEERAIGSHRASAANRETLQKSTIIPIKQEIMSENNERKEQHVNETPKSHPVAKPVVKKKKKETSNTSLYVILALLLLLLGVGIFYYFYYDRLSYNEFNSTTQHTQTTDDSFLLPGDSAAVQESEKSENVDTSGVTASGTNESTATSPVASTSSTRKEQTASTASTSSKKTTPQQTKPTTDTSTSSDHNVMARVKVASGERLTLLAQKYYGNKVFWVYIYDFNKAKIPDPDRVPAGMEILIPAKEVYAINAQSSASIAQAKELQSKIMANKTK